MFPLIASFMPTFCRAKVGLSVDSSNLKSIEINIWSNNVVKIQTEIEKNF